MNKEGLIAGTICQYCTELTDDCGLDKCLTRTLAPRAILALLKKAGCVFPDDEGPGWVRVEEYATCSIEILKSHPATLSEILAGKAVKI